MTVSRLRRQKRGLRGYDAGKKVKGRKRHIWVDTLGLLQKLLVHEGNIQDRDGGKLLLLPLKKHAHSMQKRWADAAYSGKLQDWAKAVLKIDLEIVKLVLKFSLTAGLWKERLAGSITVDSWPKSMKKRFKQPERHLYCHDSLDTQTNRTCLNFSDSLLGFDLTKIRATVSRGDLLLNIVRLEGE